ncbi:UDP-glycosyltransferase 73C6-like isoform X2 [Tripterygium wilfordii]|uniref:UDP-glycosyltransferase 73C6-like isoform X2 n=1 Tax=Tripterygium wilfordii TaxID=458696 RepID=UPI0018F84973|nr:UDP-glycosyltransferase 73C6-like isoform X2 [Tripterygium wilfordii]
MPLHQFLPSVLHCKPPMDDLQVQGLHFVLFPHLIPGHMIPMIDIARLLAKRGMVVTIFTTPLNAARFASVLIRAAESGLQIRVKELNFPYGEAGLPQGFENLDMVFSADDAFKFLSAIPMLQQPAEELFEDLTPRPSCIISDFFMRWTAPLAAKFHVPRISFNGFSCICNLCIHNIHNSRVLENISSDFEYFAVPGFPDHIKITIAQLPGLLKPTARELLDRMFAAESLSLGMIVNTFEELESEYVKEYRKLKGNRVWCIGPVSLSNTHNLDKLERGNKTSFDENECFKWLDSQEPRSVAYACLGSVSNLTPSQLKELGLGLEASGRPFIWVLREGNKSKDMDKWISEDGIEERIKGRGLIIRGWAPQVLILSHQAIGGFLTHCGWNSILEAISMGLPIITWPQFEDQFCNEKLVTQVLKIGVSVGVFRPPFGEEEKVIDSLMSEGDEGEERRMRARELGEMANRSVEEGGSSYINLTLLIQCIMQQATGKK